MFLINIASNIKKARIQNGFTQDELAEKLSVTRQAVSAWERGVTQPDIQMLEMLAQIYGTGMEELIYGKKNKVGLEPPEKDKRKIFTVVLSVLGSLLTVTGIIILFAEFFENIGETAKTVFAFLPLAAGFSSVLIARTKKPGSLALKEGTAVAWCVGIAATNAALESLFCTGEHIANLLVLDAVLFIPVVFLTDGIFPVTAYFGTLIWGFILIGDNLAGAGLAVSCAVFVLLMLPGILFIKKYGEDSPAKSYLDKLGLIACVTAFTALLVYLTEAVSSEHEPMIPIVLGILSAFAAIKISGLGGGYFAQFAHVSETAVAVILTLIGILALDREGTKQSFADIIIPCAVPFLLIVSAFVKGRKNLRENLPETVPCAVSAAMIAILFAIRTDINGAATVILPLLTVCGAAAYIVCGVKETKIFKANLGMIMICVLMGVLVVYSDITAWVKGIAVTALGLVLLAANAVLTRRFSKKDISLQNESGVNSDE